MHLHRCVPRSVCVPLGESHQRVRQAAHSRSSARETMLTLGQRKTGDQCIPRGDSVLCVSGSSRFHLAQRWLAWCSSVGVPSVLSVNTFRRGSVVVFSSRIPLSAKVIVLDVHPFSDQEDAVPENVETLGQIPALVNGAPLQPHSLHHSQCILDCAESTQGADALN